ncbi:MAG: T9SS type A sorting domain-containing protein [Bacteroidetes bacterium]|nr:T9SS type A sorting domain-containing protein [Bacteroidota bacterium]
MELQPGDVSIYPVPNQGLFTAQITSAVKETVNIRIYNDLSQLICEKSGTAVNNTFRQSIDLRPLSPGVYTVVIRSNNKSIARKILVIN